MFDPWPQWMVATVVAVSVLALLAVSLLLFRCCRRDKHKDHLLPQPYDSTTPPQVRRYDGCTTSSPLVRPQSQLQYEDRWDGAASPWQRAHSPVIVETYASLRDRANEEQDLMSQCYEDREDAYDRRDRTLAKSLSKQARRHEHTMNQLNQQASSLIFKENNKYNDPCNVDLHGLYAKEALAYSERAVSKARRKGEHEVRLIVGRGRHSDGGVAVLKPVIQKDMKRRGFRVRVDPHNPGVLVVQLSGR